MVQLTQRTSGFLWLLSACTQANNDDHDVMMSVIFDKLASVVQSLTKWNRVFLFNEHYVVKDGALAGEDGDDEGLRFSWHRVLTSSFAPLVASWSLVLLRMRKNSWPCVDMMSRKYPTYPPGSLSLSRSLFLSAYFFLFNSFIRHHWT